jgi:hypothetical protein
LELSERHAGDFTAMKSRTKRRILEFLLWTAVAIATAVILTLVSDKVLPTNF